MAPVIEPGDELLRRARLEWRTVEATASARRLLRAGLLAAAAVILMLPPASGAAKGYRHLVAWPVSASPAASQLFADGVRWAAYEPVSGSTELLDARMGSKVERPDPAGCGSLKAIGHGELLYECESTPLGGGTANVHYAVVGALSGAQHPVPGELRFASDGGVYLDAIGADWAQGCACFHHASGVLFVNWHTGRQHFVSGDQPPSSVPGERRDFDDLDTPTLTRPLCAPLARTPDTLESEPFEPFAYGPPFAVGGTPSFVLRRCGTRATESLPGAAGPESAQFGAGVLTWNGGGTAYVTRLTPRARVWHGPIEEIAGIGPGAPQHTSTTVYFSRPAVGGGSMIYAARLR